MRNFNVHLIFRRRTHVHYYLSVKANTHASAVNTALHILDLPEEWLTEAEVNEL